MYTLKGIFPEPKKDQRRNFIKENMKQLKYIQGKTKDSNVGVSTSVPGPGPAAEGVRRGAGKQDAGPAGSRVRAIRKGDVAEFVRRKGGGRAGGTGGAGGAGDPTPDSASDRSEVAAPAHASGRRDVGCQTAPAPAPAPGPAPARSPSRAPSPAVPDRTRLDAILQQDHKESYVPAECSEDGAPPAGHVRLSESERRSTLRTLRATFGDLVRQLNALPVRTDSLRSRDTKRRLEAQLARLEDGIAVFSRNAVYVRLND